VPELPDVEGFRRELARRLPGRRARRVEVRDAGVLRNTTAQALAHRMAGRRFGTPRRYGKWLILPTDGPTLIVHSGMTGHPYYAAAGATEDRHERVVFTLDRGELRYADQRKLRGLWLAEDADEVKGVLGRQGPDALDLDRHALAEVLQGRRGAVKATLMDQSVIAGLGNLLTDEICWQARVHPGRPVPRLAPDEVRCLHSALRRVLRTAVRHGNVPPLKSWLTGTRDDPEPHCPRCGAPLSRSRYAGRTSLWCPTCQPMRG
jgi:formamidopyrimidine-DNA glycosylase